MEVLLELGNNHFSFPSGLIDSGKDGAIGSKAQRGQGLAPCHMQLRRDLNPASLTRQHGCTHDTIFPHKIVIGVKIIHLFNKYSLQTCWGDASDYNTPRSCFQGEHTLWGLGLRVCGCSLHCSLHLAVCLKVFITKIRKVNKRLNQCFTNII